MAEINPYTKKLFSQGIKQPQNQLYKNSLIQRDYNNGFNPLDIPGLQIYLNKKNATVSSWLDQSQNALDFTQTTALKQPIIEADYVYYDGVDDEQYNGTTNIFNADDKGIIFFSGQRVSGSAYFFASGDEGGTRYMCLYFDSSGHVGLINRPSSNNIILSTNTVAVGSFFYFSIASNGSSYSMTLNGVTESFTAGLNNGDWYSSVIGRDNITLGTLHRSAITYKPIKINKLIYSNQVLSSEKIGEINNFISDVNN
jgi:hypothetical protein